MAKLYDRLEAIGYTGHPLEVYLARLLFCLFAENTTIYKQQFQEYIKQCTRRSDLAKVARALSDLKHPSR